MAPAIEFIDRANQLMIDLNEAVRRLTAALVDKEESDAAEED